jgi:hypothetical protein
MSDPEAPHAEALAAEPAADAAPTAHKPKGSFKKMMAAKMKYVSAYSSIQTMLLYILAIIAVNSRAPCAGKVYADAGQREDPLMAGQDTTLEEVWDPLAATGGGEIERKQDSKKRASKFRTIYSRSSLRFTSLLAAYHHQLP